MEKEKIEKVLKEVLEAIRNDPYASFTKEEFLRMVEDDEYIFDKEDLEKAITITQQNCIDDVLEIIQDWGTHNCGWGDDTCDYIDKEELIKKIRELKK